jgi:hypothetical protein
MLPTVGLNPKRDKRENSDCANLFHFNSSSEIITQPKEIPFLFIQALLKEQKARLLLF